MTNHFVNTSLKEYKKRYAKGLYKKARSGEIINMTGVPAPCKTATNTDLEVVTDR